MKGLSDLMHLETFDQVAAAFGARDLSIKDLYLRIAELEASRERHITLLEKQTEVIEGLQQRVTDLERRPQYVPYPVLPFPNPFPWAGAPVTCTDGTGSSYPPNEPKPYPPFGFPY
jgi:hypothetical protein